MKNLIVLFLFAIMISCQSSESSMNSTDSKKPNILFLFVDDQTFQSVQELGNNHIFTPNLNRLVKGGTTFTHAYNMGGWNGAICVASRSMIISGAYIWRAHQQVERWRNNDSVALSHTWGKLMESAGYSTYMSGKWHVAAPADQVFQTARHIRPGMPRDEWGRGGGKKVSQAIAQKEDVAAAMPVGYNRPLSESDTSWSPTDTSFGGFWQGGKHWSEVLRDDALDYIHDARENDNPFFMYIAFNAPHDPRQSPQAYIDLYDIDKIPIPNNFLPEYPWKDAMGAGQGLRDEALAPFPRTHLAVKTHILEYYAIISHLDHQVGIILDSLEASGQMDNTYIFFTADHGLSVGQHGLVGKQNMFDHSMRVPLMVMGPQIPAGQKRNQSVYLQDVMATALEIAGIEKPDYVEFNSFLDLIENPQMDSHLDAVYGAYINVQRMIKKEQMKLIVYPKANKILLFDTASDPDEINDLSKEDAHRETLVDLFDALVQKQVEMGDTLDLSNISM